MNVARGYILVETVVAMAVLAITAVTVQQAVYTALQARGIARDYTTAQLLLERLAAIQDLEPRLAADDVHTGVFDPPDERFSYTWTVERVAVPMPAIPPSIAPEREAELRAAFSGYMGRLRMEILWTRGGEPFSISAQTLIAPEHVWLGSEGSLP